MKIAVLGAGAMGSLYAAYLSRLNEVILVDRSVEKAALIDAQGVTLHEPDGAAATYRPRCTADTSDLREMDLVILFTKAMYSRDALDKNRALIGPDTFLLTLQNGAGHEDVLAPYARREHIAIGTTEHNCSVLSPGVIRHGGGGKTNLGLAFADSAALRRVAQAFEDSGFETVVHQDIHRLIWDKLFINASSSVVSGILQVNQGFLLESAHGWAMVRQLVREAVCVACAKGLAFAYEDVLSHVRAVVSSAPAGYTSLYADLQNGRRTEVDTISGAVVRAAEQAGVPAPTHAFVVNLVHALEEKAMRP